MYKNKRIVALITARGSSKRLPRKNIKPLLGKPLIAWTIEQAKDSKYIDRIIVSTDSRKIAKVSSKLGAEAPFLRPKELSTDRAKSIDVLIHAINWLRSQRERYDILVLLQPTSPLRESKDIDKSIELLFSKNAQVVVSVRETQHSPYWINTILANGCMRDFVSLKVRKQKNNRRSRFFCINGAVYVAFCSYLLRKNSFYGNDTFAYIMPKERSVDIDDGMDFMFAEFLMKNKSLIKEPLHSSKI